VGTIDATAHYIDAIEQIGFRDLWRHRYPDRREYSWFSTRNNGFRIDHAFLSRSWPLAPSTVRYSHEERIAGLSDHSPLILELAA
jgi:exodeoxyribonuclease-3